MGSRLSLRLQILLILALVLGGEALFSAGGLLLVLPRTLRVERARVAARVLDGAIQDLHGQCGALPSADCARQVLERVQRTGLFVGVRLGGAAPLAVGRPTGPADLDASGPSGLRLEGWLDLRDAQARSGRLFQFHFANLAIAAMGLLLLGMVLFNRAVAQPVERLSAVADRIGHLDLPELGSSLDAPMLGQLTRSFERMARALRQEQQRVNEQIAELQRVNQELTQARDAIVRQEKLATVGRLAAGVAHEVGNPLGGILGYAELLKTRSDPTARDYAERIAREVARIDRTVRGLLDFSRPAQTELAPLSLAASVQRALALCRADKRFREVEPRLELPEDLPPVLADEHRLGQVLVNLLLNAGDAMAGKGRVTLRASAREGQRVELDVEDTGPGIPPEVLPRIFDPFFTTKEVGQGTGLGLSISASIVDAFGGELSAENRPEGGARFRVVLRAG